jgi:hypothetical protein
MKFLYHKVSVLALMFAMLPCPSAWAQLRVIRGARGGTVGPNGSVTLPYGQPDGNGNQWMIYPGGMIRMEGNQPIYSQASMLTINGNNNNNGRNQATMDPKTGELILDNLAFPNCSAAVTRRILISKEDGSVRYIDIFKNTENQPVTLNVLVQSYTNYGVNSSSIVNDPKKAENAIGWVAMTGANRAAVEMYAGKGAKVIPSVGGGNQGNNISQSNYALNIPTGKSVAIMHFLTTAMSAEQGTQFILGMKETKVLRTIPADIRRLIINFPATTNYVGDYEILRGDITDVVELRSGDQIKGNLKEETYKLATFYGNIQLPKDQVIGIINVGQYRPRQLLVTSDGQIFGGKLDKDTLALELSSGQTIQIPLQQVNRAGYRKRMGEPEEWTFDKPYVLMRAGDRVEVEMPSSAIEVATRYGVLKLDPQSVGAVAFLSDDSNVHEIYMTDGSKFAGLVNASQFDMKLAGANPQQVKFPANSIVRLQLSSAVQEPDDGSPALTLVNNDTLVGTLTGNLQLDTAFDTLQLEAPQIKKITHAAPGSMDVQITLWDNSTMSGQVQEQDVQCKLLSGPVLNIPMSLLAEYNQPLPRPSDATIQRIKTAVTDLAAEDWKQRDNAQSTLIAMGPSVIAVLRDLRPAQPPEAQQRIDAILKQLGAPPAPKPASGVLLPTDDNP